MLSTYCSDYAIPGRAIISTTIEVSLSDLDESQIAVVVGIDGVNLQTLAQKTNTTISFHSGTLIITVHGEYQQIRQCHRTLTARIQEVKMEKIIYRPSTYHVFDHRYWTGMKFKNDRSERWVLTASSPTAASAVEQIDPYVGESEQLRMISDEVATKIGAVARYEGLGAKLTIRLGRAKFTTLQDGDPKLGNMQFTPPELRGLLSSGEVMCNVDTVHDEWVVNSLREVLLEEGFLASPTESMTFYISHQEDIDEKVRKVLWIAKPVKCEDDHTNKGIPGLLELKGVRINDTLSCAATFHGQKNSLDVLAELMVHRLESEEHLTSTRGRFQNNFRHRETGDTIILSKEALQSSIARRKTSMKYSKDGIRFILSCVKESHLEPYWEIGIKSEEMNNIIKDGVKGTEICPENLLAALQKCLKMVDKVNEKFHLNTIVTKTPTPITRTSTIGRMSGTSIAQRIIEAVGTEKIAAKSAMGSPGNVILIGQEQVNGTECQILENLPQTNPLDRHFTQLHLNEDMFAPSKDLNVELSPKTPRAAGSENVSPLRPMAPPFMPASYTSNVSQVHFTIPQYSTTDQVWNMRGKIPPPNTPANQSSAGSPISTHRSSRAGSIVAGMENDGLCGIMHSSVPLTKALCRKAPVDLLGSIDELLLGNMGQEEEADEDLICWSPKQSGFEWGGEEVDLLLI